MSDRKDLKNKFDGKTSDHVGRGVEFPKDMTALTEIWSMMKSYKKK